MSPDSPQEPNFDEISAVLQVACQKCGSQNGLRATRCAACGSIIQQKESERESLSFLHAEGMDASPRALTGSHKLKRLRMALQGIRGGEISPELYRQVVGQVLAETQTMRELLNLQPLKDAEEDLPVEAVDVLRETADNLDAFAQACGRMLNYREQDTREAEEGLAMAERAIQDMEATQHEAAELQAGYRRGAQEE